MLDNTTIPVQLNAGRSLRRQDGDDFRLATDDEMCIGYEPHRWAALITMLDGVLRRR